MNLFFVSGRKINKNQANKKESGLAEGLF